MLDKPRGLFYREWALRVRKEEFGVHRTAKATLMVVCHHMDEHGRGARCSVERYAYEANQSERTVERNLDYLVSIGILKEEPKPGTMTRYHWGGPTLQRYPSDRREKYFSEANRYVEFVGRDHSGQWELQRLSPSEIYRKAPMTPDTVPSKECHGVAPSDMLSPLNDTVSPDSSSLKVLSESSVDTAAAAGPTFQTTEKRREELESSPIEKIEEVRLEFSEWHEKIGLPPIKEWDEA